MSHVPKPPAKGCVKLFVEGKPDDLEGFERILEGVFRIRYAGNPQESKKFEGLEVQRFELIVRGDPNA